MPTANVYTPIVGLPTTITSGDGTDIPRNPDSSVQGPPRSGSLKRLLIAEITDPTANQDNIFNVEFPVPPNVDITALLAAGNQNAFIPWLAFTPITTDAGAAPAVPIFAIEVVDPVSGTLTARFTMSNAAPPGDYKFLLLTDFGNSLVS